MQQSRAGIEKGHWRLNKMGKMISMEHHTGVISISVVIAILVRRGSTRLPSFLPHASWCLFSLEGNDANAGSQLPMKQQPRHYNMPLPFP